MLQVIIGGNTGSVSKSKAVLEVIQGDKNFDFEPAREFLVLAFDNLLMNGPEYPVFVIFNDNDTEEMLELRDNFSNLHVTDSFFEVLIGNRFFHIDYNDVTGAVAPNQTFTRQHGIS